MTISLIAVVDSNMGIGRGGDQLVYISEDLKRFKALTTGHTIVMGRKTAAALPKGMLAKRRNIVMSRSKDGHAEGAIVASSVDEVMNLCRDEDEVFIIGGGEIYKLFLPFANKLYITHIEHGFDHVDTHFPNISSLIWKEHQRSERFIDAKSGLSFYYADYIRD
jgi:dihydrofolate reductase